MNANKLRQKYIAYFQSLGHRQIPSAPLLPENDPTVLFTTAGMHPLVPFLLGESHPQGKRLVNFQRCIRTNDIDEVGDRSHLTFFEMLGNWSLGDYFKEDSLAWSHTFLTRELGVPASRLAVSVFAGDTDAPRDDVSAEIWRKLGIPDERIYFLPKEDNWWGPAGKTGPCGPDSEIFYDTSLPDHPGCRPGCPCGKWLEVWNNVFMEYNKQPDGSYTRLPQPNVDTGMGVERTLAALLGEADVYRIDTLAPLITEIETITNRRYSENLAPFRVIADHLRAATMAIADGALPSNVEAGYITRRLIRRAVRTAQTLGVTEPICARIAARVIDTLNSTYPHLEERGEMILQALEQEETRFQATLERGLRQANRIMDQTRQAHQPRLSGEAAFDLFETYGFPLSLTVEIAREAGLEVDTAGFEACYAAHQQRSRQAQEARYQGGLADHSAETTRLHTASHLLQAALRQILGQGVRQMGSNITPERLRFDFAHPQRLSDEELAQVEALVNQQIERDLPVTVQHMPLDQALAAGALAFFGEKYGDSVKVYSMGDFSKEVCGGPHVTHTGELGRFKILKQEAVGQGVRRIRATLLEREE